jgi:hypothetical protein
VTNLQGKLGNTAKPLDIRVIRTYIEEFLTGMEPLSRFSSSGFFPGMENQYLKEDYLSELAQHGLGKIQFSEPRGCLTNNPEEELEYLFGTFVGEDISKTRELVKHSRLKTEIKREFKNKKLLASKVEEGKKKGFEINARISGGKSQVTHLFDFALRNGKIYLVETVDMRKKDKKDWVSEAFEAAVKFDDLSHGLGPENIDAYSIVALPGQDGADDYLKILSSYSKVFRYSDENERREFISEMSGLVVPNLFTQSKATN